MGERRVSMKIFSRKRKKGSPFGEPRATFPTFSVGPHYGDDFSNAVIFARETSVAALLSAIAGSVDVSFLAQLNHAVREGAHRTQIIAVDTNTVQAAVRIGGAIVHRQRNELAADVLEKNFAGHNFF